MSSLGHCEAANCHERIVYENNAGKSGGRNHGASHPNQPTTPLKIARNAIEPIRKSASTQARHGSDTERQCSVETGGLQIEAMLLAQVGWQPGHKKVEAVRKRKVGPKQSPQIAAQQQLTPRDNGVCVLLDGGTANVLELLGLH